MKGWQRRLESVSLAASRERLGIRRREVTVMERMTRIEREVRERIRSLADRFRWPGGRPPRMGGAVPACVVGCEPRPHLRVRRERAGRCL